MTGKSEDSDGEEKGQQFIPTDWDWVMFLSGEINAIETRFYTFWTVFIATLCAFTGILTGFLIAFSRISASNPYNIVTTIITVAIISGGGVYLLLQCKKYKPEAEERVNSLKKCREDIFNRLNDPNKILECYSNDVGKKGDKNK